MHDLDDSRNIANAPVHTATTDNEQALWKLENIVMSQGKLERKGSAWGIYARQVRTWEMCKTAITMLT